MPNAEVLAKLTPHGTVITGAGFGGFSRLDMMDVAGALGMGGLSRPAYLYGMLKYTGDATQAKEVARTLAGHVGALSKDGRWDCTDGQVLAIVDLTMMEAINPPVCGDCNGSGHIGVKPCQRCDGCGRVRISGRAKARELRVSEASYRRHWADRLKAVAAVVTDWEVELDEHINRRIGK